MNQYPNAPQQPISPYGYPQPQQPQQPISPYGYHPPRQPISPYGYQSPRQAAPAPARDVDTRSYFDGGALSMIGLKIVNFFIILFTAGICFPWAVCRKYAYVQNHTVIEGRRLHFTGTAMGLFGTWIKWLLLCYITLGIYGFLVRNDLQKWIVKHTEFSH